MVEAFNILRFKYESDVIFGVSYTQCIVSSISMAVLLLCLIHRCDLNTNDYGRTESYFQADGEIL